LRRIRLCKTHGRSRVNARNGGLPFAKHGKPRVTVRNAVDQVSKNPEILYENFQIKKAEDFAPVALFIHFQMNYRISRPRKMVVSL
jgi:hypothetical protein